MVNPLDKPAPILFARLPANSAGRATIECLRAGLNGAGYRLRVLFSGPRHGNYYTRSTDATSYRLYLIRIAPTQYDHTQYRRIMRLQHELAESTAERNELRHMVANHQPIRDTLNKAYDDARKDCAQARERLADLPRLAVWLEAARDALRSTWARLTR